MIYYKIVDLSNGKLHTLFHGVRGSRLLKMGEWLRAENKPDAYDGSRSRTYESGWHILPDWETACEYLKKFFKRRGNLIIVPCEVRGRIRNKQLNSKVLLADEIRIIR